MSSQGSHAPDSRGRVDAAGVRVAVLVARFNADITDRLLDGALACQREHGGADDDVDIYRVPGAWELPQAASMVLAQGRCDALVALGCVIRGETPHFDYVCAEASSGLGHVARGSRAPVAFGVLTTDTHDQAMARAGDGPSNKGYEATVSVLQMVSLYRALEER